MKIIYQKCKSRHNIELITEGREFVFQPHELKIEIKKSGVGTRQAELNEGSKARIPVLWAKNSEKCN